MSDRGPEEAARGFYERMRARRSVREFSDRPVSRETIEWLVRAAGSSPSGANSQPWRFVCVRDGALKERIRREAEEGERAFYGNRADEDFLRSLAPLGTCERKPFLRSAPWLIAVFRLTRNDDGSPVYYPGPSVGIAVGLLLAAAHHAGLATLVYTPSSPGFLAEVLGRPPTERPFCLLAVGHPSPGWRPPEAAFARKRLDEIMVVCE
jgi:nitroreductase